MGHAPFVLRGLFSSCTPFNKAAPARNGACYYVSFRMIFLSDVMYHGSGDNAMSRYPMIQQTILPRSIQMCNFIHNRWVKALETGFIQP